MLNSVVALGNYIPLAVRSHQGGSLIRFPCKVKIWGISRIVWNKTKSLMDFSVVVFTRRLEARTRDLVRWNGMITVVSWRNEHGIDGTDRDRNTF